MNAGQGREATRYARSIEELWQELRGAPSLFSQRDWGLVCGWYARGIPLELLREVFRATAQRRARHPPRGLSYLSRAVDEAWSVVCEGQLGGEGPRQVQVAAGETWRRRAEAPGCGEPLAALLDDLLRQLAAGRPVEDLETQLEAQLPDVVPTPLRREVEAELKVELAPFAGRLSERVYSDTFRRARSRRLRERLELPRLAANAGSP
jgi:hypothetical protein